MGRKERRKEGRKEGREEEEEKYGRKEGRKEGREGGRKGGRGREGRKGGRKGGRKEGRKEGEVQIACGQLRREGARQHAGRRGNRGNSLGRASWEGARQHAGLRGFDTEKSFTQNKTLLLCKTSSVCKSLCRAEKMNFAVNAPIMFIFQKGAGKRRKGNKPIITRICLLSFCFWVLRPPLVLCFFVFF